MPKKKKLVKRLDRVLRLLEMHLQEQQPPSPDWDCRAFQWRDGRLVGIQRPHWCALDDLLGMDRQKAEVVRNTRGFVEGRPANNVLLWGSRGTGKSTLVKAVFNAFSEQNLRLVEVEARDLEQLPLLIDLLQHRDERFLLYCDDLSFEAEDARYKGLKAVLEGSIVAPPDNLLIYATSNRRHLMPEYQHENRETCYVEDEVHPAESIEEKVSLSERFGLWLSFYPFTQQQYLAICSHWLKQMGAGTLNDSSWHQAALQWASQRGSRSGRVARQFAIDWLGRD